VLQNIVLLFLRKVFESIIEVYTQSITNIIKITSKLLDHLTTTTAARVSRLPSIGDYFLPDSYGD
jgi:hypothetical protein